jgi:hypothetical protein
MTLHELVADKLERADPATRDALLRIPLENIDRWIANGHTAPHRLEEWRELILNACASGAAFRSLLFALRDEGEAARRLRDFAPFAGILTHEERQQAEPECAYHF